MLKYPFVDPLFVDECPIATSEILDPILAFAELDFRVISRSLRVAKMDIALTVTADSFGTFRQ